jgi:hypothetical protein
MKTVMKMMTRGDTGLVGGWCGDLLILSGDLMSGDPAIGAGYLAVRA